MSTTPPDSPTTSEDSSASTNAVRASKHLSIGEVLSQVQTDFPDVTISKIRFLESRGLVEPQRAASGYRQFSDADIRRLRWILTMQRDHFLPLRVIKERLEADGDAAVEAAPSAAPPQAAGAAPRKVGAESVALAPSAAPTHSSRFRSSTPGVDDLSPEDFARLASLDATKVSELVKFGLIEPHDNGEGPRYTREALQVAKASAAFLAHGIEPRHLKAWRVAAEREAGMLEQIVRPLSHQGSKDAQQRACEVADTLIDMGNAIRESIIVRSLRDSLGIESD